MKDAIAIRKMTMLSPLSEGAVDALAERLSDTINIGADSTVVSAGDSPGKVHVLLEGWAARVQYLANGERQITAFLLPGDLCDHQLMLFPTFDHSICTLTRGTLACISRSELLTLTSEHADLARAFWLAALLDEAIARAWITNIGARRAPERVAHLLLELYTRLKMVGLTSDHECELPITQTEIADSQGLTAVHVNRVLQGLRGEGLIRLAGRRLILLNLRGLARFADFDPMYLRLPSASSEPPA